MELLDGQPSSEERLRYVLRGRGLTHTQEDVVLGILGGQTSAQIGSALHYSRGAINTARATAYKVLGVHSRSELIATLHQLSGL
ncbi:MAG: helix-turn-helix transcriptional regulator [Olsenella profusa]